MSSARDWIVYGRETDRGTRYGLMNNTGADTGAQFPDVASAQQYAANGAAPIVALLVEACK